MSQCVGSNKNHTKEIKTKQNKINCDTKCVINCDTHRAIGAECKRANAMRMSILENGYCLDSVRVPHTDVWILSKLTSSNQ